jgi:hypothetical protein
LQRTQKPINAVGDLVPGLLRKMGITTERYAVAALVEHTLAQTSPSARVVGFRSNRIDVEVESSVELQELTLRRREISKILKQVLPADTPCREPEIRFFIKGMAKMKVERKDQEKCPN